MYRLVLVRHGQSEWNKKNLFTGWQDIDLSEQGAKEALDAGKLLKKEGFTFDLAYTSYLKRAIKTLNYILEESGQLWIPVKKSWKLNERHYGALQGLNKEETRQKYGKEQVHLWRRSYQSSPPALETSDPQYPGLDPRYNQLDLAEIPLSENLEQTVNRVLPYWREEIAPQVKAAKKIIISAHGNSLRALVKILEELSAEELLDLEIPTGRPLVYHLSRDLKAIKKSYL